MNSATDPPEMIPLNWIPSDWKVDPELAGDLREIYEIAGRMARRRGLLCVEMEGLWAGVERVAGAVLSVLPSKEVSDIREMAGLKRSMYDCSD